MTTLGAVSLDPPTANGWKVTSGALTVGTYTIVATDANRLTSLPVTLNVTCANSKVPNAASNACISAPTVTPSQTFSTTTPVILGTVGSADAMGNPPLDATEAFKVVVNGVTYTYKTDAALKVVGTTAWELTIPTTAPLTAGQSYPVVATRDDSLSSPSVDIKINGAPTVTAHPDTFDTTPIIAGTVGATALGSDTFSVKINNQTYPYAAGVTTDGNVIVNALTWRLTIPTAKKLPAGTYPIEAVRNTLSGTGSIIIKPCALPSVVNETADTCSLPVPTVVAAAWNSNTPTARIITGTVGDVPLGSDETFTVTIKNTTTSEQIYTHATPETDLKVTGMIWTLTIPTVTEIIAGNYSVEAARNTTAKNTDTAMKLQVTLVCNPNQTAVNGGCVPQTILPTVDSVSTTDTTPTITGTVGTLALTNSEIFTVKVDDTPFPATNLSPNIAWSVAIPVGSALTVGAHTVVATRGSISGTGTITVTDCTSVSGKRLNATGKCVDVSLVPTVNKSSDHDVSELRITVSGTVGDTALTTQELTNNAFDVTITEHGKSNPLTCALIVSGTTWTCEIVSPTIGTFDVTATRGSKADITNSELVITKNIAICDENENKSIPKTDWDGKKEGKNYYLGKCNVSSTIPKPKPCTEYPGSPQTLPLQKTVTDSPICDNGGARSETSATNVTIKRATIINGTTKNGTVTSINNTKVIYGEKESAKGDMDISNATIGAAIPPTASCGTTSGTTSVITTAENVTLTGVTLNNAYIESSGSFNADTGEFTPSDSWIKVLQGTTSPTDMATPNWISTIIGGVITAGADVSGNPIRGSINSGRYDVFATDPDRITKSRRVTGKIVGATVTNATTMTSGGSTFVLSGTITAGTFEGDNSAFGTVVNASITGTNLSNSNHCFSSGTVGTRGQLNWKEVVKE